MRFSTKLASFALAISLINSPGFAAICPRTLTDAEFAAPLTEAERSRVVAGLATMAEQIYVEPIKGKQIADALRAYQAKGSYRAIKLPADLANKLTVDMRSVVADKHLQVRTRRVEASDTVASTVSDSPEAKRSRMERFRRSAAYDGFGIREVKMLPGNIGYLNLGEFWAPEVAGEALRAAMTLLKGSDALIIDLRSSYGGHEGAIPLLTAYLLPSPQPLFTSVDRRTGKSTIEKVEPADPQARVADDAPVYVLTSQRRTFSAAEALALVLKRKRGATLVGERTRGGANGGDFQPLSCRFDAFIPYFGSTVDGISWEGSGIAPDVAVRETDALDEAYRRALSALVNRSRQGGEDSLDYEIREERQQLLTSASTGDAEAVRDPSTVEDFP